MNIAYLLLGSNMGNSLQLLSKAKKNIEKNVGCITRSSNIYITAAWGNTQQPDFLNQVIIVHTLLTAAQTLQHILGIETAMGRIRTVQNAPRIIDIDILFFNKEIINTPILKVPHPQITNRKFVLIPLNELSPNFKHPVLQQNIHQLLSICTDSLNVLKK
jgi:2-amino-4-hydroxy-6-hydroxymethyldihydropteridine diphosphokinase